MIMTTLPLLSTAPAPDAQWLRQFTRHLLFKRPALPRFSARQLALQAFEAMYLLTPYEACELWDQRMLATNSSWRRMAGR
jgi:hypothetical protein